MRRLLAIILSFPVYAVAAPHLYADVQPGVTSCGMVMDGAPKVSIPVVNNQCKYDLVNIANGSHTVTLTAITTNDPVWGTQESDPSPPFVFVRPARPEIPVTLRLAP